MKEKKHHQERTRIEKKVSKLQKKSSNEQLELIKHTRIHAAIYFVLARCLSLTFSLILFNPIQFTCKQMTKEPILMKREEER